MNARLLQEEPSSAEARLRIHAEQVGQLYEKASLGIAATVVNSAVLTCVQWKVVSHQAAVVWFCSLFVLSFLRFVQSYRHRRGPIPPAMARNRGLWFIAGLALSGIAWGAGAVFLFPLTSTAHQVFLAFVVGGMVAGAAGTFSVIRTAFLAYAIPALAPLIIRFFIIGDEIHIAMGGMTLLYAGLILAGAMRVHATSVLSLKLRFENSDLIAYLASAKERAEKLNKELGSHREHLEELVEARTAEWSSANEQLQKEIAARKGAEKALRQSEEYFRSLIENALDIITVLDSSGNILFESPSIERLLGYSREELVGKNVLEFVHPDDRAEAQEAMSRLIRAPGTSESIEVRLRHRNGVWRLYEAIGKSMADGSSGAAHIIVNSRDNTERRRLEEDILKAQKLESLGTLAGGIAHDFNNILTGVTTNLELAAMHSVREDRLYTILKRAEQAAIRAKDLTQQLLTFSRGGSPIKATVPIGDLIREAAGFALRGSRVECDCSLPGDRLVEVDVGQMRQVIHNIVINADQAMPQGGIIKITCANVSIGPQEVRSLTAGDYVKIAVEDQGIGIPKEHIPKIFDPYFTTKQNGNGLGLAAAYAIIKKHGGDMVVESETGVGTTLTCYLPVSLKEIRPSGPPGLISGRGKILLMDDEEMIRDAAGRILQTAGYEVALAATGDEAIELFRQARESGKPFDAVIMDLTMPGGIGGKEALTKLRKIDPAVKAIVSSGYSEDPIMANYRDYGFQGVIAKPYRIRDMSEVVSRVMEKETSVL